MRGDDHRAVANGFLANLVGERNDLGIAGGQEKPLEGCEGETFTEKLHRKRFQNDVADMFRIAMQTYDAIFTHGNVRGTFGKIAVAARAVQAGFPPRLYHCFSREIS